MSETSGGWFLTHGDGEVHGPFTLPALVDGARLGNILPTTQLRHETHTSGQWLPATRIRPVAQAINAKQAAGQSPSDPTKSAPTPTNPSPANPPRLPTSSPAASSVSQPQPQTALAEKGPAAAQTQPAAAQTQPVASAIAEVGVEAKKKSRFGSSRAALTVPDTFGAAVLALFDFRFRYFITPWIIKITWGICVAVTLTWLLLFTIGYVIQPIVSSAKSDVSDDIVLGQDPANSPPRARTNWEFQPPTSISQNLARAITYFGTVLFCALGLLYVRVLMELAIVAFRIAIDLGEVKEVLREK